MIRMRKLLSDAVWEYPVSGDLPTEVNIDCAHITVHTYCIENIGN